LDFDRRGKEWTAVLRQNLEKAKIKSNVTFRRELRKCTGRELKDIEGLSGYMQTLKRKLGEA
jgi:5S rRNA maturation endonuclease (ribonuclease M5)